MGREWFGFAERLGVMSLRMIAQDLYRAQRKVAELQKACESKKGQDLDKCKRELLQAEQEMQTLRQMLGRKKESGGSGKW
jgi:hypothetical protein